jgi:hypothetical protein
MTYSIKTHILNNRLSYKLLLYILLSSVLFTFLASALQLFLSYRKDMKNIEDVLTLVNQSYLASIESSLWSYDTTQLETQVQGILSLPNIIKVVILDESGSKDRTIVSTGYISHRNYIERVYSLKHGRDNDTFDIGTMTVYAGLDTLKADMMQKVFSTITMKVVEIFILAMCILTIFHYLIMKHLSHISRFLRLVDINHLDVRLSLERKTSERKDILDFMVGAINGILEYLATDISRRKETEDTLRKINEDLEQSKREIEEQNRIKTMQMAVSDILREEENLEGLASRLIAYLCDFMGAGVGLFYHVDAQRGIVRAVGAYALNDGDLAGRQFKTGEGMVGQAVLDRRIMTMEFPGESCLDIQSSLGFAKPSHILIFPFERKGIVTAAVRSEERRVGKECRRLCRSRWSPYH